MVSVGHLGLCGSAAAQGLVQPGRFPSVRPPHRGHDYGLSGLPDPLGMDEFGLAEVVDPISQAVIARVLDYAYRRTNPAQRRSEHPSKPD